MSHDNFPLVASVAATRRLLVSKRANNYYLKQLSGLRSVKIMINIFLGNGAARRDSVAMGITRLLINLARSSIVSLFPATQYAGCYTLEAYVCVSVRSVVTAELNGSSDLDHFFQ